MIGDMMFELGLRGARDQALVAHVVATMLRRGPAGILRLLRNAARVVTGRGEHPASADWWRGALHDAGFADVDVQTLGHEGGIAVAHRTG